MDSSLDNIYINKENELLSAVFIKNKTYVLRFSDKELSWIKISNDKCTKIFQNVDISEVNS